MDIESILDEAEPPQASVTLCLKGTLVARYEALDAQLRNAAPAVSLGDSGTAGMLREEMAALRETMLTHERTFTFQALPPKRFSDLRAKMPDPPRVDPGKDVDQAAMTLFTDAYHEWVCGLVAAVCIDPQMSAEQADRLSQKLSDGQWRQIRDTAWAVNSDPQAIPFSAAAYALTALSDERSRQPEPAASPDPPSLADRSPSGPSVNTTTPAG